MKTKQDFVKAIDQAADKYDQVAALRRAGDPRYFQHQEAMATMFAMLSQQIEIGMMEPFDKARDATVLADAALRGILPKAACARVKLMVKNTGPTAVVLAAGRRLTDSGGFVYEVDRPVTVPAASSDTVPGGAFVEAVQRTVRVVDHTVSDSAGFYSIEIPPADDGRMLAEIQVRDSNGEFFRYSPGFTNVQQGERVFNVEVDAYRRLFVRFGLDGVVGYQPKNGEVIKLTLVECDGDVRPEKGSQFSLEYAYTPMDGRITLDFYELMLPGASPLDIHEIRELCKFPSVYDESAVFLGEFEYVVRKHVRGLKFLSIWNEQLEEQARGPNFNNINVLFVALEADADVSRTAVFDEVSKVIKRADDSLKVRLVETHVNPIAVKIEAQIARVHDQEAVRQQIRQAVLNKFGMGAITTRSGMFVLSNRQLTDHVRDSVPALQDKVSDFVATITSSSPYLRPEQWSFVSESSLDVKVTASDYNIGGWGR